MEILNLLKKGIFKIVLINDVLANIRIFNIRFVDEVKNKRTEKAFEKSRLVIQIFNNNKKDQILIQLLIIQRISQRLIFYITVIRLKTTVYIRNIS